MQNTKPVAISEAIKEFLDQLSVGKQPNTVRSYGMTLRRYERFLEGRNINSDMPTEKLTVDHVIEFAKSLRNLAPATIRNYLAAISEFYRFLFARRMVEVDMAEHERLFTSMKQMRPRSFTLPHVPPDEVIDALIAAASKEPEPRDRKQSRGDMERAQLQRLRNVALLLSLRSSGMRLGEALALRRGDLDYRNKAALVTGKGRKQRIVYFDNAAWDAIQEYLQARQDGSHSRTLAQLPLYARHDRRAGDRVLPLTRQRIEQLFAEFAADSKIDPPPTPHWLRHWFATRVLERTQDLAALQDMLGHASPVTTRIYAKVSTKRLRQVHGEAFDTKAEDK